MDQDKLKWIRDSIRDVPDFPKPGILFKDITTLIRDPRALADSLDLLTEPFADRGITAVAGMESRGFIFGVGVAERLGVGFVPIRKPGKLPAETVREEYELEYGTDSLEMHRDAVGPGDRVLVVDDLLATGGTAEATVRMLRRVGAEVAGAAFVIELGFLKGRAKLSDVKLHSLVLFD
jgi:adenine phosphoribosyltransferase